MTSAPIPGSYPDSIPPTPEETMQQPAQPEHQHRQRNKLHKADDPRGHRYTDSGVGIPDPDHAQFQSQPTESNWIGPDEAVGGGTYTRENAPYTHENAQRENAQRTAPLESIRNDLDTATPTQETENDTMFRGSGDEGMAAGLVGGMAESGRQENRQENTEATRHSPRQSGDAAPYWGNLPKGADGGVYNTVAGHGSAADDHDQHHHLPPKSAHSETSIHIPGHVANYPRGGVYNTVTGHGSQDDTSRRHSQARGVDDNTATGTNIPATLGPVDDSMLAAPLPDIPEERQKTSRHATFADTPGNNPGFLPETAVRDDVRLAEAASGRGSHTSSAPGPDPVTSQREFPLTTGSAEGSTTPVESRNDQPDSESQSKYGAAAAGVAGLGAGAAASQYVGKRRRGSTPADQNRRHSRSPSVGHDNRTAGGVVTGKRRSSRQRSPAEHTRNPVENTRSHEEGSPKGERKHSKILGIFHRNKDDGKEDKTRRQSVGERSTPKEDMTTVNSPNRLRKQSKGEATMERRRSPSSAKADTDERSGHGKEKTAAGAAAGAGAFGLLHHRKKNSTSEKPQDTANPTRPMTAESGGAGPAGDAPHQVEDVSTPFEHPREPPMVPQEANSHAAGAAGQPGSYNALASGTPSGVSHGAESGTRGTTTNEPGNYNKLATGTASGVAVAAAGASARNHMKSKESGDYNTLASSGAPPRENTRRDVASRDHGDYNMIASSGARNPHTTRRDVVSQDAGDYNMHTSSGAPNPSATRQDVVASDGGDYNLLRSSGISPTAERARRGSSGIVSQDPGHYNMLASGVPSGVKTDSGHSASQTGSRSGNVTQEPGHYNTLASGVPSGIKQDSGNATGRSAGPSERATDNQSSEIVPEYNTLPSGTPSGVKVKPRSRRQSRHASDPVSQSNDQTGHGQQNMFPSGAASGFSQNQGPADITTRAQDLKDLPLPPQAANTRGPNTHQPDHTIFAAAPIPSHVRSSHPNPSQESVPGVTTYPNPEMVHNMSPEVMPDAYTASAPGHSHGQGQSQGPYDYPPNQQTAKVMSPAIIPAAYAASAAGHSHNQGQGNQGQGYQSQGQTQNQYDYPQTQQTAKGMSPAVMPSAYTASAPGHSHNQGQSQNQNQYDYPPNQQTAKGMSPAVMPAAYTESAPGHTHGQGQGQGQQGSMYPQQQQQQQQQQENDRTFNPALAAAATSWAASSAAAKHSGQSGAGASAAGRQGGGVGKVMHRCQQCGGEEDIGGVVERVVQEMGMGQRRG